MTEEPILNNGRESNGEPNQKLVKIAPEVNAASGAAGSSSIGSSSALSNHQNGFSFEKVVDPIRSIHCKDLASQSSVIRVIEFSDDGSLLVSGGDGNRSVLVWRMDKVLGGTHNAVPVGLEDTPKNLQVFSVAITPDKNCIFVGGRLGEIGKILVFNPQT